MATVKLLDPTDPRNKLERYELIGEIASGGMAVVYLARIAGLGGFQRFVAIKRLHPHLAGEDEFIEMFLDEARLAAGIHHPHVVPILEVGASEQGHYLVMEYIEGDTLARVASRAAGRATGQHAAAATGQHARPKSAPGSMPGAGPAIPRPVTVRVLLDALAGLHAAHELTDPHGTPLEIVHRDISPQNILVGVDGSARITDFGVARAAARLTTTRSDTVKGKLAYLSPEQARGELVDRRSDLFAMGIILWEMLTGRRLFRGETDQETIARVNSGAIPAPSSLVPGMHPAFDAVVLRALARDVAQRFATCAEMGDALERAAAEAASAGDGGGVAQPREVAAFMNDVLGQEIAQQREGVRVWLAQRNDPTLASTRPGPPPQKSLLPTGQHAIIAPLPAPALPGGMPISTPPPPMAAPVIAAPHPDDGDPTMLRVTSGLTQGAMARSAGSAPPAPPRARVVRVAGIVLAAGLLAVGVVLLLRPGGAPQADLPPAAAPPSTLAAPSPSAPAPAPSSAAPAPSPAATTEPAATAEPTAQPSAEAAADAPSAEPTASSGPPPSWKGRWKPPASKATAAPAATAAATSPPKKPPSGGDDLSNPYK